MYARVKRAGTVFVSEDLADPLLTELILIADDPAERQPAPVANAQFDVGSYLHQIVQSSSKSMTTNLSFTAGTTVGVTMTIKALGENNLTIYDEHAVREDDPDKPQELDKLKADIREREAKLDALAAATDRIDKAVQETSKLAESAVHAGDIAALRAKITALEEQNQALERDRAEAERKVTAHVAHASKIKDTYNQLAGWYNNLRNEHVELQKKKLTSSDSTIKERKDLPVGVATTHEADVKNLEKERDELQALLQRERNEKKDMYSRNSELLESKARTLAELAEQWEAAKATLRDKQNSLDDQVEAIRALQSAVDDLKSQLGERDSKLEEQTGALTSAREQVKNLESKHAQDLSRMTAEAEEEFKAKFEKEVNRLKREHEEDLALRISEYEAAHDQAVESKLSALRAEHADELGRLREEISTDLAAEHLAELERIRKEHRAEMNVSLGESERNFVDSRGAVKALDAKLIAVQGEKNDLEKELSHLKQKADERDSEIEQTLRRAADDHQAEIKAIQTEKEELEKDLVQIKERVAISEQEGIQFRKSAVESQAAVNEELESAQAELEVLRKTNEDLQNSPRDIASVQSNASDVVFELEAEVNRLKSLLKTETEKKEEIGRLLSSADVEHDELRAMVTRLRSERDGALRDLKQTKDIVPDSNVNTDAVQHRVLNGESGNLLEERDKAIRELFRVRKTMKKEVERLKKENAGLNQKLFENHGGQDQSLQTSNHVSETDREGANSELRKLRDTLSHLEGIDFSQHSESTCSDDISSEVSKILGRLRTEIETYKTQKLNLEKTAEASAIRHSTETQELLDDREELRQEIESVRRDLDASTSQLQEKERSVILLSAEADSSAQELSELSQRWKEAIHHKELAESRSMALSTELDYVRESLHQVESSNPSLESELQKAQKQYAEAKATLSLLQLRYDELNKSAESARETFELEIARLESILEEQTTLSNDLSQKLRENEESHSVMSQEQVRLAAELESREREVGETKILIQKLKSRNASLTAKLAGEKNLRESTENHLGEAATKIGTLEKELQGVQIKVQQNEDAMDQLRAERNQVTAELAETKKRLDAAESILSEKKAELDDIGAKLRQLETHQALQKEVKVADGKSQTTSEELTTLRAELMQSQSDLQRALGDLDSEIEKGSARVNTEHKKIFELEKANNSLVSQHTTLESKLEAAAKEFRSLEESHNALELALHETQQRSGSLNRIVSEKSQECDKLRAEIGNQSSVDGESKSKFEKLVKQYKQVKMDLSTAEEELKALHKDKQSDFEKIGALGYELAELHERVASIQEANEEAAVAASANADKDARKITDLRKELRSATSMINALQDEIDQLRESNTELKEEVKSWKERADDRDSEVLKDLINTRMELAYSQEETIRLRNKLKKLDQSGQGSSSFEY